jgi:hypothetical protein
MNPNEHVTEWLAAYHDGELSNRHKDKVEAHLRICPECLSELKAFQEISSLLLEAPDAENLTAPEVFATQVGLRLPRRPEMTTVESVIRNGWRFAPVGILGSWAFMQAALIVSRVVTLGLTVIPEGNPLIEMLPSGNWPILAGMFQLPNSGIINLGRLGLDLLGGVDLLGWGFILNIGVVMIAGLLYLSWLASWWIQKTNHQDQNPSFGQ